MMCILESGQFSVFLLSVYGVCAYVCVCLDARYKIKSKCERAAVLLCLSIEQ